MRVSCNPAAVGHAAPPADAIALLGRLRRERSHAFRPMDRSLSALPPPILGRIQGYRQITEALLLALAIRRGGRFATLDARLVDLQPTAERDAISPIPI